MWFFFTILVPDMSHHNHFTALFPGPSGWAGARRELLDFMVQGKINRGRHSNHPAGRHSIRLTSAQLHHSWHTTTTTTIILLPFVWDYLGEPVPEKTFTHPPPLSTSSLIYLLVWSPPRRIPYISSPSQCLIFATHAYTEQPLQINDFITLFMLPFMSLHFLCTHFW